MALSANNNSNINIISFNCKGLKSSFKYIDEWFVKNSCDIMFLSEHWLSQQEIISFNYSICNDGYWAGLKTSINHEESLRGRPFGGVGFLARETKNFTYKLLTLDSERLAGMEVLANGSRVLRLFGVYLPYYNGKADQVELLCETLDKLQHYIDEIDPCPFLILGDMNTELPCSKRMLRNWHSGTRILDTVT